MTLEKPMEIHASMRIDPVDQPGQFGLREIVRVECARPALELERDDERGNVHIGLTGARVHAAASSRGVGATT